MKNKKIVIAAACLALIAAASIGPASAYFTASKSASGTKEVYLGDGEIVPDEEMDETGTIKTVSITNTSNYDVWVRVKVFSPDNVTVTPNLGASWSETKENNEVYYSYSKVLEAQDTTDDIVFEVSLPTVSDVTDITQKEYNVIIVEEATRAEYGEEPDWNNKADATRVETKVTPQPVNPQPTPEGGQR